MTMSVSVPVEGGRASLTSRVARQIISDAISGRLATGRQLPQEAELAGQLGVSRLTLREATRTLQNVGVLRVERGRGTFVNDRSQWTQLDPTVLEALLAAGEGAEIMHHLTDLRRVLETGLAALAAPRRDTRTLSRLDADLAEMEAASAKGDVAAFARADVDFHDAILEAAANPLVMGIYRPLHGALQKVREETSKLTIGTPHAIKIHRSIYDAIASGDAAAARAAMTEHFDNTDRFIEEAINAYLKE